MNMFDWAASMSSFIPTSYIDDTETIFLFVDYPQGLSLPCGSKRNQARPTRLDQLLPWPNPRPIGETDRTE